MHPLHIRGTCALIWNLTETLHMMNTLEFVLWASQILLYMKGWQASMLDMFPAHTLAPSSGQISHIELKFKDQIIKHFKMAIKQAQGPSSEPSTWNTPMQLEQLFGIFTVISS